MKNNINGVIFQLRILNRISSKEKALQGANSAYTGSRRHPSVYRLLTYFVENQGLALSREKILNNVWNYDYFGDARTIDTHVKKLRSKMGDKGEYIKTIWGMGYKFEVSD